MFPSRQRLLVFTRYPEPGATKTRLIPALGPQGAADLQRRMTRRTLAVARRWQAGDGRNVEVWYAGGDAPAMRRTFGHDLTYAAQAAGSLGERLCRGFEAAHREGCHAAVAIGTDCPDIDEAVLDDAFQALQSHDVVIGPATDGGYYLVGLRRPIAPLFDDIAWGSSRVLEQTRTAIERLNLKAAYLAERSDVDQPDDLPIWEQARQRSGKSADATTRVSVIIPAINEADRLAATLASVENSSHGETLSLGEIIVVDGGSRDATIDIARSWDAQVVPSSPGRAVQMNAGARAATGDVLLFLHADTRLPLDYVPRIESCLSGQRVVAGAFRLAFDDPGPGLRLIAAGANLRSVYRGLPYGDQGLFLRRATFDELGGFRPLPVMEDYDLVRRLRQRGRIAIVPAPVITSARRWQTRGLWRTTLLHQWMIFGWHLGIDAERLARWRRGG